MKNEGEEEEEEEEEERTSIELNPKNCLIGTFICSLKHVTLKLYVIVIENEFDGPDCLGN